MNDYCFEGRLPQGDSGGRKRRRERNFRDLGALARGIAAGGHDGAPTAKEGSPGKGPLRWQGAPHRRRAQDRRSPHAAASSDRAHAIRDVRHGMVQGP